MASGVPVISTNVSGISELIEHSKNGLLVQQRNTPDLAAAMELLIAQPDLRFALAQRGREAVLQNFTLEASAQRVYDILGPVLDHSALRTTLSRKADIHVLRPQDQ